MYIPKRPIPKIRLIKQILRMPFHAFFRVSDLWVFWVENEKGDHLDWTGKTIMNTINDAMEYVQHEIEMGVFQDPELKKKEDKQK